MELCPCMGYVCQYVYDMCVWQCLMYNRMWMNVYVYQCVMRYVSVCVCVCICACGDISMCMCDMTEYSNGPRWNVHLQC